MQQPNPGQSVYNTHGLPESVIEKQTLIFPEIEENYLTDDGEEFPEGKLVRPVSTKPVSSEPVPTNSVTSEPVLTNSVSSDTVSTKPVSLEPVWSLSKWGECNSTCSTKIGIQTRDVSCSKPGECKSQKPETSRECYSGDLFSMNCMYI